MLRLLTLFLILHWAAVFSLLAVTAVSGGLDGVADGLSFFGLELPAESLALNLAPFVAAVMAIGFCICAVLFWWAFATSLLSAEVASGDGDDILRMAFTGASALMTAVLVLGVASGTAGIFPVMATHFAALMASLVAIRTEQGRLATVLSRDAELRLAARVKALDASRRVGMPRLAIRNDGFGEN